MGLKLTIGTDLETGKTMKVNLNCITFDDDGDFLRADYRISFHEPNDDEVIPTGTEPQKKARTSYNSAFCANGLFIDPSTKLYVSQNAPGAVTVKSYFSTKALNSYTNTTITASNPTSKVNKAIVQEIVDIKKANGEFPII